MPVPQALRTLLTAALLGAVLSPPTDAADETIRKGAGRFAYEEAVLDNGMRVISLEDHSAPIVAVQVWYHVGSKDEQVDRQGFAHMFEHMMFRGTDRLGPTDHFDHVKTTGGNCNAYTAFDQTVYIQELPSNQLDMVLWLEAERMARLKIDEGGFSTERKVVEEERRMGLNQPYGLVLEQVLDHLFTRHPYRWSPIGKIDHLRASTAQDIQSFWDTYYVPNNATLVVVGDVTHESVRELAAKNFGWIPRCADPPRVTVTEPVAKGLRRLDIEEQNGPAPIGGVVFMTVPDGHPDSVPLEMLAQILGGGESSRLYVDIVRRKNAAAFAGGAAIQFEQAGMVLLGGLGMPVVGDVDEIIEATWEQIALVKEEGVTDDELEKARHLMERAEVTESLTVASKAQALGYAAAILGDTQLANVKLDRVRAVTADDLKRVATTYLVPDRASEVRVEPTLGGMFSSMLSMAANMGDKSEQEDEEEETVEGGARAVAGGPKAEAERPEALGDGPPTAPPLAVDIRLPSVRKTLDNGLDVVVVENHEVPFASLSLRLTAGAFTDAADAPGTASMAASMVTRGTWVRDAESLAAELENHAIELGASAGHDSATVNVSAVSGQVGRAMRLLAEVVQLPRFDEEEFRTLRDQTATGMSINEQTPSTMADRALSQALWGDHPYGRPAEGTSDDLKAMEVDALAEWWSVFVRPETAVLYVAGDVTPDQAFELAELAFGDWEAEGDAVERPLPSLDAVGPLAIKLVDKKGAVQSEIRAGHRGITRRHPLHAPGVVLSQILGGGFNSRLNASIRVEKGLTYGARGGLSSRRFGGDFRVSTFTKTPKTAETVRAVIDEVQRMLSDQPTGEELDSATSYLAGSFAGSIETPQAVASRLWSLELNDLPEDYWTRYLASMAGMTSEAVVDAARQLLHPDDMVVVVVGDASEVKESLEEIAEVEVITSGG
jgi:zinc protease